MPRTATFEYKAPSPGGTGGGYPRVRSWEHRPHTARQGKEDVYVPVHRLCAVAWFFPDDWSAEDILQSGELLGADVHHELGMPAANIESELALYDHGRHSEITQSQMRAWGEDAKQSAAESTRIDESVCAHCGGEADVFVTADAFDGKRCLECGQQSGASEFEVV